MPKQSNINENLLPALVCRWTITSLSMLKCGPRWGPMTASTLALGAIPTPMILIRRWPHRAIYWRHAIDASSAQPQPRPARPGCGRKRNGKLALPIHL